MVLCYCSFRKKSSITWVPGGAAGRDNCTCDGKSEVESPVSSLGELKDGCELVFGTLPRVAYV